MGTTTRSGLHKAFEATPQNTMSSGYGQYGGVGRCFPFWQDVLACYVVNTSAEDDSGKKKCAFALEDYYECLHHKKEHARAVAMQTAFVRQGATNNPDAPTARTYSIKPPW